MMGDSEESAPAVSQQWERDISVNECQAIRYLKADGYSDAELKMLFQSSQGAIAKHANEECNHQDVSDPVVADPPVGEDLALARRTRGLTLKQVAEEIGVSPRAVGRWEKRETIPRPIHAQRLEEFFEGVEKHHVFQ